MIYISFSQRFLRINDFLSIKNKEHANAPYSEIQKLLNYQLNRSEFPLHFN